MLNTPNGNEPSGNAPAKQDGNSTLKLAGYSFIGADAALFLSGALSGKWKEAFAGVFGWMAGFVGARYGKLNMDKQVSYLEKDVAGFFQKQGIDIPDAPETQGMKEKRTLRDTVESLAYTYPSQIMNGLYSLVGLQFIRSAVEHKKPSLLASGLLLVTGAMNAIFTEEKKPDPENPPQGVVAKIKSWVQEKPLRTTGALFNANQVTLALDAVDEWRRDPAQKTYLLKGAAVAGFSTGNVLMGMTDKSVDKVTGLDEAATTKLVQSSARVIAEQPAELRDTLLQQLAGYLSTKPSLAMNAENIGQKLQDALTIQLSAKANSPAPHTAIAA